MPRVDHEGLDELDLRLASCPFVQRNSGGKNRMVAVEAVGPGGISKPMRMFTLAGKALAVLPAAGHLNPSRAFGRRILMPGMEVAHFQLDFWLKLSLEGAAQKHCRPKEEGGDSHGINLATSPM